MYEYRGRVASVYDGDSIRLDIDLGFGVWTHRQPFRLAGIDAPELGTPEGRAARDWLRDILPVGTEVAVITYKDREDKYGRMLARIWDRYDAAGDSVNDFMIDAGHAVPYDGGAR